jgi:hypothetical protein
LRDILRPDQSQSPPRAAINYPGNSPINRDNEPLQPYFHRRDAVFDPEAQTRRENAKELLFLFFAERAKNKKIHPTGKISLFLCRPLNGKGKNISLCALCGFAVKFLFIRLPLLIEPLRIQVKTVALGGELC